MRLATPLPRPRWPVASAVLLLHLLLAWLGTRMLLTQPHRAPAPPAQRIALWLQPLHPVPAPHQAAASPSPRHPKTSAQEAALLHPPTERSRLSQTTPLFEPAPAETQPSLPPEPSRPSLNLSLPSRGPMRHAQTDTPNPALLDARSNSRAPTLEQRIAQVFGTDGAPEEERVSNTVRIFRKNGKCVVAEQSRSGQIFAMDAGSAGIPWGVRPCH